MLQFRWQRKGDFGEFGDFGVVREKRLGVGLFLVETPPSRCATLPRPSKRKKYSAKQQMDDHGAQQRWAKGIPFYWGIPIWTRIRICNPRVRHVTISCTISVYNFFKHIRRGCAGVRFLGEADSDEFTRGSLH